MLNIKEIEQTYNVNINTNFYDDGDIAIARYCLHSQSIELSKEAFEGGYNIAAIVYHELGHHEDMMLPEVHKRYFQDDNSVSLYEFSFELVAFINSLRLALEDNLGEIDYKELIEENEFNMEYYVERLKEEDNFDTEALDFCKKYVSDCHFACQMAGVSYDFSSLLLLLNC